MSESTGTAIPLALIRALWVVVVLLGMIGLGAALGRTVFTDDFVTRAEPARRWLMEVSHRNDPFALERAEELARVDGRFAAHQLLIRLHIIPGAVFLLVAPLQFSTWIRTRHIRFHRWTGRILLPAAIASVLPGLYFGVFIPYGGLGEAVAIALFGGLFLIAICLAFLAIRKGQTARHREWMIRVFAIAIAISTVRVIAVVMDAVLTPAGVRPADIFVLSIWTGWIITLGVAELWIRYTRPHRRFLAWPESAA